MDELHEMLSNEDWQLNNYHRLGFDPVDAIEAVNDGIDYHEVEALMEKGCSKETALEILAPLEKVK